MDQSLEVFRDSFQSFYIFGIQKCKNQHFGKKISIKLKCTCLPTGPGDLNNTKHLKFDLRQIFYLSLKNKNKSHFARILKIVSSTR